MYFITGLYYCPIIVGSNQVPEKNTRGTKELAPPEKDDFSLGVLCLCRKNTCSVRNNNATCHCRSYKCVTRLSNALQALKRVRIHLCIFLRIKMTARNILS